MRNYLLAAVAAAAIATPAVARDGTYYVGADIGVMKPQDTRLNTNVDFLVLGQRSFADGMTVNYNTGFDADLNAGYDFGMFRVEGEVAYKHAGIQNVQLNEVLLGNLTNEANSSTPFTNNNFHFHGGNLSILSGMVNALLDFGDDQWGGFAGAGAGLASTRLFGDHSSHFAWQGIAGLRYGLNANLDQGGSVGSVRSGRCWAGSVLVERASPYPQPDGRARL